MNSSLLTGALLVVAALTVGLISGVLLGRRLPGRPPGGSAGGTPGGSAVDPIAAVTAILGPAADALSDMREQLRRAELDRVGSHAVLREQVAALHRTNVELGQQTRSLVGALRAPTVRGRWGELQLQRVVELAGMLEHCDFDTQVAVPADGADLDGIGARPDMVIRLAGGRHIPVDAKVPFQSWLQAADNEDERHRERLLRDHAAAMRRHVDELAGKAYWRHFQPSPEFVVLFVPGEPLVDTAMRIDPGLAEYALARHVVIATPTTLVALLRTIAFTWRAERLSRSAEQLHALGRQLHARLSTLSEHLGRVGSSLQRSVESYNAAVRSYESRVLVSARRLVDLGAASRDIPGPDQIDTAARAPRAEQPTLP